MHRWSTRTRTALGSALLCVVAGTVAPASAGADSPTTAVTVFLKAPDLVALHQLAEARGLTHAQRVAAVTKLLPSAADRATAINALKNAGFKVADQTAWSVSATAPQTTVTNAFGAHSAMRAHASTAQRKAASGPYPSLPAGLDDVATAAFPTSSGPKVFQNANTACDCNDGTDYRNAYTSPALTNLGQPPYSGQGAAAPLTIATVQLAGWNSGDLTHWANTPNLGVSGFNLSTDVTQVPVDQGGVPGPTGHDTDDEEVDLDQQALLSTAPYAHQRPYFAPNTDAGFADAFAQVLDDVLQDGNAYQGGDPRIAALSLSWGQCEADTHNAFINALEPILSSLVAAGVTIFASSGDAGIYDGCSSVSTDYPSSSPSVIAVGGTSLNPIGSSAPNNGSNWAESAWSCSDSGTCAGTGTGGSGGGASATFTKPSYQSAITNPPFADSNARLVPDISANADPNTGFVIYTSNPIDSAHGDHYFLLGGTSLAAPVSAALFTNALAAHGATSGIGDIHHALYTAYAANNGAFRDITIGSNGSAADAPNDPSVNAGTGYDTVTGLGAPLWPGIASYLFDPTPPPNAIAKLALAHPHSSNSPRALTAAWAGFASSGGAPVQNAVVTITRAGKATPVYSNASAPATGTITITGSPGATYTLNAIAVDLTGNASNQVIKTVSVPVDDRQFSRSGTWHRVRSSADIAGSAIKTSQRNATATATATGSSYAVVVRTGPGFGKLQISAGFNTLRTINLNAPQPGHKTVTFYTTSTPGSHTFRFTCLGKTVGIDGMTVSYF